MKKSTDKRQQNSRIKFGIIGYGSFGKIFAAALAQRADVLVASRRALDKRNLPARVIQATLKEVAGCDVVILANELARLESDCREIARHVNRETVVMDVCSVKVLPAKILKKELANKCQVVASHPLFGPQSVNGADMRGKIIVWHEINTHDVERVKKFFIEKMGLKLIKKKPYAHDREMAWVHALSFFIGRGLINVSPPPSGLATNYYKQLLKLHDIETNHSLELFRTIQLANPYAKAVRENFLAQLELIESDLEKHAKDF